MFSGVAVCWFQKHMDAMAQAGRTSRPEDEAVKLRLGVKS